MGEPGDRPPAGPAGRGRVVLRATLSGKQAGAGWWTSVQDEPREPGPCPTGHGPVWPTSVNPDRRSAAMNRDLIETFAAGGGTLRRAVEGLSRDDLLARPGPGDWSIQELVIHV